VNNAGGTSKFEARYLNFGFSESFLDSQNTGSRIRAKDK
jgi:hypothetical protein